MICPTGHSILARIRSHKKLHISAPSVDEKTQLYLEQQNAPLLAPRPSVSSSTRRPSTSSLRRPSESSAHGRNYRSFSASSHATTSSLAWDPLALNPSEPIPPPTMPGSTSRQQQQCQTHHHASLSGHSLRPKRSLPSGELRRPRLHHSESSFTLAYKDFDFGFERQKAIERLIERNRIAGNEAIDGSALRQQCVSPTMSEASSTPAESDVPELWHDGDYETAVAVALPRLSDSPIISRNLKTSNSAHSHASWEHGDYTTPLSASPRRRLPLGGQDDEMTYFIKRGGWKRRGIVFGGQQTEVCEVRDDDVFDI